MNEQNSPKKSWDGPGQEICSKFVEQASQVILNKKEELKLALICFLAEGHLLIEDIPGVGKTTFVKTLRHLFGLKFNRIQFTSDLLPGDILGTPIYEERAGVFKLHPGPIFAEFILADELNRATPRTQSALLQAMEEGSVSIDQETYELSPLFYLVATQNPRSNIGTYPLPESQLDRFLMRIQLGYPGSDAEISLLQHSAHKKNPEDLSPLFKEAEWLHMRQQTKAVHVSKKIAEMIFSLLTSSRNAKNRLAGLSTRAGLALAEAAKATAFLSGRDFVIPEDIKYIAVPVINHRINQDELSFNNAGDQARKLVNEIEIP